MAMFLLIFSRHLLSDVMTVPRRRWRKQSEGRGGEEGRKGEGDGESRVKEEEEERTKEKQ